MYKIIVFSLFLSFSLNAQNKKPAPRAKLTIAADTTIDAGDTLDMKAEELKQNKQFGVYTRKPYKPFNRMKLCLNLVSDQNNYNFCINDSVCKYPENSAVLFQKKDGDSTFVLVWVDAVTKIQDKPECDAGHETKLFFVRWNTKTNKAIWKQRTISSCAKAITNMNQEPIKDWDKSSVLKVKYHKGGTVFVEMKFDPENYRLGFQSNSE